LPGIIKYKQSVLFVLVIVLLAAVTNSIAQKEAYNAIPFEQILKKGQVLSRIYFEANNSKLGQEGKKELDKLARELSSVSGSFMIRIEGYTDSAFERQKDILLSMQRAQAVKLYFSAKHPNLKISFYMTGFGARRPLLPLEGESQETLNKRERRVEMVLYPGAGFFADQEGVEIVRRLKAEVPVAEVPVAEAPVAEVPVAEAPVAEAPVAEVPVAEVPVAEVPVAEVPVAEA
jgi:outer membrane protein OmpA-like peptidoglycan-associated protein